MSIGPDPQALLDETRKQINRLIEEVGKLSEMDLAPADYYGEFLKRVLGALTAPAAAVWGRTAQGNLQLQYQINMRQVGLDRNETSRQQHDELLRQIVQQPRPLHLPPHASTGTPEGGGVAAGNPTDYLNLIVPIVVDNQVAGMVEVWQSPDRHQNAIRGFLQFLSHMAELVARYMKNHMLRTMVGQQQVWTQMEAFARQIHGSLNPMEVAYLVANEGRRLIDCDRVSVGVRHSGKVKVEAISGADVVEKRSNLVQLMRALFEKVIKWGDKLVYTGTKDDTLPPDVLEALDLYLAESNSKFLVVQPLRDERENETKNQPRSAIMMECFDPTTTPEQLTAKLEVVARHATAALYNAVEHRRIPMRFIWDPIAKVQEGLGGKTKAIVYGIGAGVLALLLALVVIPYPLKMDANGQLLPVTRRWVYSPLESEVNEFLVEPKDVVRANQDLVRMRYDPQTEMKMASLKKEIDGLRFEILQRKKVAGDAAAQSDTNAATLGIEALTKELQQKTREAELAALRSYAPPVADRDGYFTLKSPEFPESGKRSAGPREWTVLNSDFRENLSKRWVKPSDPLLRLGDKEGPWEIELKIPQKHIGQVLKGFDYLKTEELDVDLLVRSQPTKIFRGKLTRDKIGGEATPNRDDNNELEPIVLAFVRIEGDDIPKDSQIPRELMVTGVDVRAKVRCGSHSMGYSLFYGVWEFFYEKVVFFF